MKMNRLVLLGIALALLTGCASKVHFRVKRAPAINLGAVKKIGTDPFAISGTVDVDAGNVVKNNGLVGAVVDLAADKLTTQLAKNNDKKLEKHFRNGLQQAIMKNAYFELSPNRQQQARISGSITYQVKDKGKPVEKKLKDGKVEKGYRMTRTASVQFEFMIKDRQGKILGSSTVAGRASSSAKDKAQGVAMLRLKKSEGLIKQAMDKCHPSLLRKIAPYFSYERRILAKGKSDFMKRGNKAAQKQSWDLAAQLWQQGLNSKHQKDRDAALYNMAIVDETNGELEAAIQKYQQSHASSGDEKCLNNIAQIKRRIKEEQELADLEAARDNGMSAPVDTPVQSKSPKRRKQTRKPIRLETAD
jgi:tetratricopeptide (TPR) repeat protein